VPRECKARFTTLRNQKLPARVSDGHAGAVQYTGAVSERPQFKIGQLVNYLSRESASGVYQITQLLPPEDEAFQYRIKNVNEPHERVAKENELRSVLPSALGLCARAPKSPTCARPTEQRKVAPRSETIRRRRTLSRRA
jgi:hypothetical protein